MILSLLLLLLEWSPCIFANMAIARPFATQDQVQIIASFEPWEENKPCSGTPDTPVDLFLCYSRSYSEEQTLWDALKFFAKDFEMKTSQPNTWQSCFQRLHLVEAGLTAEQDTYDASLQGNPDANWVEGPNRQFLAMAQAFQTKLWGTYDTWYLMEMDSLPMRPHWLDDLMTEVKSRAPFSILGSHFRGDRWDVFQPTISPAMLLHINGNAVYNISHPLLHRLLDGLAADASANNFTVAFDVRMAEFMIQSPVSSADYDSYLWDSTALGNYAATTMLTDYLLSNEAITHGARFYQKWDQETALVVSDWGLMSNDNATTALDHFLQTLDHGHHPFRKILVQRPAKLVRPPYTRQINGGTMLIEEYARTESGWFDWCNAEVDTPYFMYSNVHFDFGRRVDLLQNPNSQLPLATYVPVNSSYCLTECSFSVGRAHAWAPSDIFVQGHFLLKDMVIKTTLRDQFCSQWSSWFDSVPTTGNCNPLPGPTATDYIAWLAQQGMLDDNYEVLDVVAWGQRDRGSIKAESAPILDSRCGFPPLNMNATNCHVAPTQTAAGQASASLVPGCTWRPGFATAFNGWLYPIPRYTAKVQYESCASAGWAVPIIMVTNNEDQPQSFQLSLSGPFSIPASEITIPAKGVLPIKVSFSTTPSDLSMVISGNLTFTNLDNAATVLKVVSFSAYNMDDLTVEVEDLKIIRGKSIRITGSGARGSILEYCRPNTMNITFLFPVKDSSVQNVDGTVGDCTFVMSNDPSVPNIVVLDTDFLPKDVTSMDLTTRQTLTLPSGDIVHRCWHFTVELVSTEPNACSGVLSVSNDTVISGTWISAGLSPLTVNFDNTDVTYSWNFNDWAPFNITQSPRASLRVPFLLGDTDQLTLYVTASDTFGRQQNCWTQLKVLTPDLKNAAIEAGCLAENATASDVELCLEISGALLYNASDVQFARQALSGTLDSALRKTPKSTMEANAFLSGLTIISNKVSYMIVTDDLQAKMIDVTMHYLSNAAPDTSSVKLVVNFAGPLLTNAVPKTIVSNATLQQSNAKRLVDATDLVLKKVVCSTANDIYNMQSAAYGNCLRVNYGTKTRHSIAQRYGNLDVETGVENVLPNRVSLTIAEYSHGCNAMRDELGSTETFFRALFLNSSSCSYTSSLNAKGIPVIGSKFFLQQTQSAKLLPQEVKFLTQATSCISVDSSNNVVTSAPDASGNCYAYDMGALTASTTIVESPSPSPPTGGNPSTREAGVSPSPVAGTSASGSTGSIQTQSPATVSSSNNNDSSDSAVAIGVGIGVGVGVAVLACCCCVLAFLWYRRRRERSMENTFEGYVFAEAEPKHMQTPRYSDSGMAFSTYTNSFPTPVASPTPVHHAALPPPPTPMALPHPSDIV